MTTAINRLRPISTQLPDRAKTLLRRWLGLIQPGDYLPEGSEAERVIAARSRQERPLRRGKPGVNIVGYVRSELGVGETARLCALSAREANIPFSLVDFSVGSANRAADNRWQADISTDNPYAVNIIHVNADQLPRAYEYFGRDFFEERYNVGVWHWELPDFPVMWQRSFELVDEVWAPTRFIYDSLKPTATVPVFYMPHAVAFAPPAGGVRSRFGLPRDHFLFLSLYDMRSSQERKNPQAAVEAFRLAFPEQDPRSQQVGLVIKVMNAGAETDGLATLRETVGESPDIWILDETLSRADVYALESSCDAFVSLHRAEGFGLGLAESMLLEKPVVATNWSGNVDFMSAENSLPVGFELVQIEEDHGPYPCGQRWANPDVEQAADFMRQLAADRALCRRLGRAGRQTIEANHSPALIGARYRARLRQISAID